jgi:hypothetical protein
MRTIYGLFGLLLATAALGQEESAPVNLAEPATFGTKQACLANCDQVFSDCKAQCRDTSARADERHFDTPDVPVDQCIQYCEKDLGLCRQDC